MLPKRRNRSVSKLLLSLLSKLQSPHLDFESNKHVKCTTLCFILSKQILKYKTLHFRLQLPSLVDYNICTAIKLTYNKSKYVRCWFILHDYVHVHVFGPTTGSQTHMLGPRVLENHPSFLSFSLCAEWGETGGRCGSYNEPHSNLCACYGFPSAKHSHCTKITMLRFEWHGQGGINVTMFIIAGV